MVADDVASCLFIRNHGIVKVIVPLSSTGKDLGHLCNLSVEKGEKSQPDFHLCKTIENYTQTSDICFLTLDVYTMRSPEITPKPKLEQFY